METIKVKKTTEKGQQFLKRYTRAQLHGWFRLRDVYKQPSTRKSGIESVLLDSIDVGRRHSFCIIAANTFSFSCAWQTEQGLRVETPANSYLVVNE